MAGTGRPEQSTVGPPELELEDVGPELEPVLDPELDPEPPLELDPGPPSPNSSWPALGTTAPEQATEIAAAAKVAADTHRI
jgi:hypothetical protein